MSSPNTHAVPQPPIDVRVLLDRNLSEKRRLAIYRAQVNAFINAADIVELTEDILKDILEGFDDPRYDIESVNDDNADEVDEAEAISDIEHHLYGGEGAPLSYHQSQIASTSPAIISRRDCVLSVE